MVSLHYLSLHSPPWAISPTHSGWNNVESYWKGRGEMSPWLKHPTEWQGKSWPYTSLPRDVVPYPAVENIPLCSQS